jgi:hypothetical protein
MLATRLAHCDRSARIGRQLGDPRRAIADA